MKLKSRICLQMGTICRSFPIQKIGSFGWAVRNVVQAAYVGLHGRQTQRVNHLGYSRREGVATCELLVTKSLSENRPNEHVHSSVFDVDCFFTPNHQSGRELVPLSVTKNLIFEVHDRIPGICH